MKRILVYIFVFAGLVSGAFLTSCGDDAPSTNPAYYTPGGYWTGSVNGEPGVALVNESGDFTFIASDGEQWPGTLAITDPSDSSLTPYGASFTGSMQGLTAGGYPNYGVANPPFVNCVFTSGTIVPRQSINGTAACISPAQTYNIEVSWTFSALYSVPSALATISGTYDDTATGTVFTINSNGTVFAQDATTGCVINGTVSIISPSYGVYGIQVSYANCTGSSAQLNNVTLAGMVALDSTKSPEQLLAGVWTSGLPVLSVTYALVRTM